MRNEGTGARRIVVCVGYVSQSGLERRVGMAPRHGKFLAKLAHAHATCLLPSMPIKAAGTGGKFKTLAIRIDATRGSSTDPRSHAARNFPLTYRTVSMESTPPGVVFRPWFELDLTAVQSPAKTYVGIDVAQDPLEVMLSTKTAPWRKPAIVSRICGYAAGGKGQGAFPGDPTGCHPLGRGHQPSFRWAALWPCPLGPFVVLPGQGQHQGGCRRQHQVRVPPDLQL